MGVKGSHGFFRKKKVPTEVANWEEFIKKYSTSTIFVDLMATSFMLIREKLALGKSAELIGILASFFKRDNIVVVLDGKWSRQKAFAHSRRQITANSNIEKHKLIIKALKKRKRITNYNRREYKKSIISVYRLKDRDKNELINGLREKGMYFTYLGVRVVMAAFEADVFIASQSNAIAVSSDSDYLFHRNVAVSAVLNTRKKTVLIWKTIDVRQTLNLSQAKLTTLGILSGMIMPLMPKVILN
jgi:hypothetical protein